MTRTEIKNKVIEYLKTKLPEQDPNIQIVALENLIPYEGYPNPLVRGKDLLILREIVQEYVIAGLLLHGKPGSSIGGDCSLFTITTYGRRCLETGDILPYDPEGYLEALKIKVPQISDVTFKYISECISAYNHRYLLSATITLGVASERLILDLIDSYELWLTDPGRKRQIQKAQKAKIYRAFSILSIEIDKDCRTGSIPNNLAQDLIPKLDGIFNFVRLNRNATGHPTGTEMSENEVYAFLQIFGSYSKTICDLIQFFS